MIPRKKTIAIGGGDRNYNNGLIRAFAGGGDVVVGGGRAAQITDYLEDNPLDLIILDLVDPPPDVGAYFEIVENRLIPPHKVICLVDEEVNRSIFNDVLRKKMEVMPRSLSELTILKQARRLIKRNAKLEPTESYLPFLEALNDGLIVADGGFNLLWANSSAQEILHLGSEEILLASISALFPAEFDSARLEDQLITQGVIEPTLYRILIGDGAIIELWFGAGEIYSDDKKRLYLLNIAVPDESEKLKLELSRSKKEYQEVIKAKTEEIDQQVRRRYRELQSLFEINRRLAGSLDPDDVVRNIAEQLMDVLKSPHSVFLAIDGKAERISGVNIINAPDEFSEFLHDMIGMRLSDLPFASLVIHAQDQFMITDIAANETLDNYRPLIDKIGIRSLASVVFRSKMRLLGVLFLNFDGEQRDLEAVDITFITALATQGAASLENAFLYREALDRRRVAEKLHHVTRAIISELRLSDFLSELAGQIIGVLEADRCAFFFLDEGRTRIADIVSPGDENQQDFDSAIGMEARLFGFAPDSDDIASPQMVEDPRRANNFPGNLADDLKARSALMLPLVGPHRNYGFILVVFSESYRSLSSYEIQLAMGITAVATLMLENTRFFDMVERSKDDWEKTVDSTDHLIWLIDSEMRFQRANRPFLMLTGLSLQQLIGKKIDEVLGLDNELRDYYKNLMRKRAKTTFRGEKRLAPGKEYMLTVNPVFDKDGQVVGAVNFAEDIGEKRRLERELRRAQKMSEIGKLASGVAHEINNPLNSMLGYVEAVLRRAERNEFDAQSASGYLQTVRDEIYRTKGIVDNLLEYSRVRVADLEPVDLEALALKSIDLLKQQERFSGIEVTVNVIGDQRQVDVDPNRLKQALIVILVNAFEAMGNSGKVEVRLKIDSAAEIKISDSGPGIAPEIIDRIFDPFFSDKKKGEGLGLGLSICREIIELHGGTIEAGASELGGAEFRITLPLPQKVGRE